MNFSSQVIADFAVIMVVAALITYVFHKLNQPTILGYLIAGIIIGPYTPPFSLITQFEVLEAFADSGVILLLFTIGLEFPLSRLKKLGISTYVVISVIEIILMFLVSFLAGWLLHWSLRDSLFLGMALSSSSTVVIAKVLRDMGKIKDISATVMMGVLIAEDLLVVFMLAITTSLLGPEHTSFGDFAWTIVKMLLFVLGSLAIGAFIIPKVIDRVARPERNDPETHDEVLVLVALGLCFGLSILGNTLGLSLAIGAFLMGILVAGAKSAEKVNRLTNSTKDMFAAVFFVSMGAFIDITQFQLFFIPALIVTGFMLVGKVVGCGIGTRISGYDFTTSLKVGLGMGQIGEFALIVVKTGQDMNVINSVLFPTIGVAVGITAFLTPYLIKLSYKIPDKKLSIAPK